MSKKYTAYLANFDIEVPVFSVDPTARQMVIKVSSFPKNIAVDAGFSKQEFVTYWYDPGAGGNRLIAQENEPGDFNSQQIVDALMEVANAMRIISQSRLKRETIVALIKNKSPRVMKQDIEIVLDNLDTLEKDWLKAKPLNQK